MKMSLLFGCFWMLILYYVRGFNIDIKQASVISGPADSYFGYSVAMMVERNKKAWIFIGAPRDNDTGLPTVNRPGAIHKCDVRQTQCEQLHIDNRYDIEKVSFVGKSRTVKHGKDGQWLGVNIDVPPLQSGKGIVTCSHRWYNRKFKGHYFMNGFCYEIPSDLTLTNTIKYPAVVEGRNQTMSLPWRNIHYFGMAAMGMAVHISKKDSKLLLGTPGLFDWTGGFLEISGTEAKLIRSEESIINETKFSLYGSAITSGEYFGDGSVYYVIGGPRANLTGKVVLFNGQNRIFSLALTDLDINNDSMPINAYFGSVLSTADVNNDGLDDLLVGAPLYSPRANNETIDTADQGRVFLYLGTKRTKRTQKLRFSDKVQMISGREIAGAHFGTAISGLGDINDDSFEDVVISAPYEEENRGAIYIYNGYNDGLYPKFSQRIATERIGADIMGFGISLSKPADLNWDGKADVAVGAFLSDQAVILYGQPVINMQRRALYVWNGRRLQWLHFVARNTSEIFLFTTFLYKNSACTSMEIEVDITLDADRDFPRLESLYTKQSNVKLKLNVSNELYSTNDKESGHITPGTTDFDSPIVLKATYRATDMNCPGMPVKPTINAFDGSKPDDPLLMTKTVLQFKKDCPENKCETDLHLDYQIQYPNNKDYFTSGMPFLDLLIKITKDGHPSYDSNFIIIIPKVLRFRKYEQIKDASLVSCSPIQHAPDKADEYEGGAASDGDKNMEQGKLDVKIQTNETGQVCSFGNPMYNNSGVEFLWRIEVPTEVTITSMTFNLEIRTQSIELNPEDNRRVVHVQLWHEVAAGTSGRATPETVFVGRSWSDDKPVEHLFELKNNGPSMLPSGTFDIHIPQYQHGGRAQLFVEKFEIWCTFPCAMHCSFNKDMHNYDALDKLDCSRVDCAMYHCAIANLTARGSATISVNFAISKELQRHTKDGVTVTFTSKAEVHLDSTILITNASHLVEKLSTSLIPLKPKKSVWIIVANIDWWIIVASVIGGIALLSLIIFILYKGGFFKRKQWKARRVNVKI